ncbi:MAG: hypothetical protein A3G24_16710 [Betaproteobacteria bacterium RIFCSPLOWO2_12_FULL_62_13]|nr:MAG: hypothetical protein A3G24_16710 [Betaproteobacteria bacterium RIFCSPLOWO2_12_FULL_62_13]
MKTFLALAALVAATTLAFAQNYPSRPVHFISPYAPGGGTDIMARTLAQKLSEATGQQFIVENRPGGGGIVGTEAAAKSLPDGYTILLGSKGPMTVNPALYKKLPYNTLRDFQPLALVAKVPAGRAGSAHCR